MLDLMTSLPQAFNHSASGVVCSTECRAGVCVEGKYAFGIQFNAVMCVDMIYLCDAVC